MTDGRNEPLIKPRIEGSLPLVAEQEIPHEFEPAQAEAERTPSETEQQKTPDTSTGEIIIPKRKPKVVIPVVQDEVTERIEKILEDGVGDAYSRLSPAAKQEFKIKGEVLARNIRDLLKSTHIKVKKVFELILEWLRLLPGINRFFLEQEAKIKTDRILALRDKMK